MLYTRVIAHSFIGRGNGRGRLIVNFPSCRRRRLAAFTNSDSWPRPPEKEQEATSPWPNLASLAAEEKRKAEGIRSELKSKLKSLLERGPADNNTSSGGEDLSNASEIIDMKQSWLSRLLVFFSVCVFVHQWHGAWPLLLTNWKTDPWTTLLASLLIVPDTPAASSWLVNLFDFSTGNWGCFWTGCFVNSGLLPLWLSISTYNETGRCIEGSFGPLMLLIHVVICGLGSTLLQVYLQPLSHQVYGISGTGIAAGLVVSFLFHQLREQRDRQEEAKMEQKANKEPSVMQAEQGPNLDQINDSGDSGRSKAAPPQLILSRLGKWTLALSFLLCLHQPMANLGGWLGAVIGGAAAGAGASFLVLDALRYAIFGPVIVIFFLGEVLSMLTGSLIPAARNMTLFLTQAVLQIAATIIQALRAFFAR